MRGLVLDALWEPKPDYVVSSWEKRTGKAISGNSIWRHPKLEVREWPDPQLGPNDVLIGERKVCGILTELDVLAQRIRHVIATREIEREPVERDLLELQSRRGL